jgi:hypothetical protein
MCGGRRFAGTTLEVGDSQDLQILNSVAAWHEFTAFSA